MPNEWGGDHDCQRVNGLSVLGTVKMQRLAKPQAH